MKCQACNELGYLVDDVIDGHEVTYNCEFCEGTGKVGLWMWIKVNWWIFQGKLDKGT